MNHNIQQKDTAVTTGSRCNGLFKGLSPAMRVGLCAGAAISLAAGIVQLISLLSPHGVIVTLLGIVLYTLACMAMAGILTLIFAALKRLDWKAYGIIVFTLIFCIVLNIFAVYMLALCLLIIPAAYLIYAISSGTYKPLSRRKRYVRYAAAGLLSVCAVFVAALAVWQGPVLSQEARPARARTALPILQEYAADAKLLNPSNPGNYTYKRLYYAAPEQKLEPYPGKETIESATVDASQWVEGWNFIRRNQYGFGPETVPLNGQVWMPDGAGPFPLALIVHGNHEAAKRSDGGYEYLGELLASRGIIAVSVDENFLNSSAYYDILTLSPLKDEIDARAFIVLEHVRLLHGWNSLAETEFYGTIDFDRLALIGHSRGGEAAALAAAYSRLKYNPENGMIRLDYPFTIDTVVALSTTDEMYRPADMAAALEGVNYLTIHGAQDMDVSSFEGANMFRRASVSGGGMKAQVYIQHANHGQFNSGWGRFDNTGLWNWGFKRNMLMPMDEQQEIAKVFTGAFLASALQGETAYDALFERFTNGPQWLPRAIYTMDCISPADTILADFERTSDLAKGKTDGTSFQAEGFSRWATAFQQNRSGVPRDGGNRVLVLEWEADSQPVFRVDMNDENAVAGTGDSFRVSLCSGKGSGRDRTSFLVRLTDEYGVSAELPIDTFGGVSSPLHAPVVKAPFQSDIGDSEPVLQSVVIPVAEFSGLSGRIVRMEWLFNGSADSDSNVLFADDFRVRKEN